MAKSYGKKLKMFDSIEKRTFYMEKGRCILPSESKIRKKLPDDIAKVIYYSSRLLFMNNNNVKELDYEIDIKDNRLSYVIDGNGSLADTMLSFLKPTDLPIMLSCYHKRKSLYQKPPKRYEKLYLIFKSKYYETWINDDGTVRYALSLVIKNYEKGVYPMYLNFNNYVSATSKKPHYSINKFQEVMNGKGLVKRLMCISEKAFLDVFG
jgi:hypothetical protein